MKNEKKLQAAIENAIALGLGQVHIDSVVNCAAKKGVATAIRLLKLNIKVELEGALDNVVATEITEASRTTGLHGYFAM